MDTLTLNSLIDLNLISEIPISLLDIGLVIAIFVITTSILNIIIHIFKKVTVKISEKTKMTIDDKLFSSMIKPFRYFSIIIGLLITIFLIFPELLAFEVYELNTQPITIEGIFVILFIFGFTYLINNILLALISWYKEELALKTKSNIDNQMIPIVKKMTSILVYAVGGMIILDLLGIEIAPLLAGLGIGGLAVALALQDTLSNFFAGMYMLADKPIEKGNYISFDGFEGYVEEISWRNTKIRSWDNNLIILPNSKLSQTTLVNYTKPNKPVTRVMRIGVSYDSDPDNVIKVLETTLKNVLKKTEGGDKKVKPVVKFADFKDSSIEFKLIYGVTEYTKRFSFEDKLKLEIFKTLKKNNIEIPYPVRTVYIKEQKKGKTKKK